MYRFAIAEKASVIFFIAKSCLFFIFLLILFLLASCEIYSIKNSDNGGITNNSGQIVYTSETEYSTNEAIDFSVHNKTDDVLKVFRSTSVYGDAFVEFVIQQKVGENDWEIVLNPLYHGIYVPAIYLEPAERETFSLYIQSRGEFQWEKGEVYRIMLTILKPSDSMRGWDSLDEELVVSNPFLMK